MGKRKLFLLFLSSMAISIIIMVIVYGVFIKDFDFSFNVKNPEMAPSPIDGITQDNEDSADDENKPPVAINTPEEAEAQKNKDEAGKTDNDNPDESPITEVVPLEPQLGKPDEQAPVPDESTSGDSTNNEPVDATPTLHYVYLDGFSSKDAAEQAIQQLQDRHLAAQPYVRQHRGRIILQFGIFSDKENAESLAQQLRNQSVFVKVE